MAKMNSTAAFALLPEGQNVIFTPVGTTEKIKGKIKGWNDEKQKFRVERVDGEGTILLAFDRLKKGQGRPPVSEEDKKAKAAASKAQTPAKASAKDKDESAEIEANELDADSFEEIGNALKTMIEMLDPNTLTLAEMAEKIETIKGALEEMHCSIMGHHAHLTQTSDENEESDEAPAEEKEEDEESEVKTKPKALFTRKK